MTPSQAKNAIRRSMVEIIDPKPKNAELDAMWKHFDSSCAYCGTKMNKEDRIGHTDHLVASASGGRNHIFNRVLACPKCNGDVKLDLEWRQFMDGLDLAPETRMLQIRKIEEWQELHREGCFVSDADVAAAMAAAESVIADFEKACEKIRHIHSVKTNNDNSETPCIRTLRDKTFFVPYYQRGYRWEKMQVEQLLNDIKENTEGTQNYSLQPIVVAQKKMAEGMLRWELIDGQQRLTTLNLILLALEEKQIPILYERNQDIDDKNEPFCNSSLVINKYLWSRITCPEDWKEIKQNVSLLDTVDNHHIVHAWLAIKAWLGELSQSVPSIKSAILDLTTVIWHEVGSENGTSEFLRFNTGKIHLSPCELLKARFLATYEPAMIHRSPTEIAAEWDQMESAFHEAEFWSFLNPSKSVSEAPNRIALLFELLTPSKKDDLAGRCYLDKFPEPNQIPKIEEIWCELRRCFLTLQQWFAEREIRHKVGFVRWSRGKDVALVSLWKNFQQGRFAFNTWLSEQVRVIVAPPSNPNKWESATYDNDNHYLQDMLFWFNIRTLPPGTDYPFARHATVTTWSLEHIHAQNSPDAANREQFTEWKNESIKILEHLKNKSADKQNEIQSAHADMTEELSRQIRGLALEEGADSVKLKEITEQARRLSGELETLLPTSIGEDLGRIWNLALLGGGENSSLSNNFFHQKREKVLKFESEMDEQNNPKYFVPPATVRVFLKTYSNEPDDFMLWGTKDRETYKKRLGEVLKSTMKEGSQHV